jgi:alkylated DNA repair dioxygenase AlkB
MSPLIPGLQLIADFVTPAQEHELLATIDSSPWRDDLERRVQHYGWVYDYKRRAIDDSMFLGPLPSWALALATRLRVEGYMPALADQLIVNEYVPGQGISKHVDCKPCFGPVVASLSLGSATTMVLQRGREQKLELRLPVRSLLVLAEDARYVWSHMIPGRASDMVDGVRRARARRVSLTFRTVLKGDS